MKTIVAICGLICLAMGSVRAQVPAIFTFSPASGAAGTVVTLSGTNFSSTAASNIVYFGAVQAMVVTASVTNLVVTVPASATFAPISVTVSGLTAYGNQPFMPTFSGNGSGISASSFAPIQNLTAGNGPIKVVIADIDGDGKPDLVVANTYGHNISIFRNISTNGSLSAASFLPPVTLTTPSGTESPTYIEVADVDGDGKLDIIAADFGDNLVSIWRNTSTPGSISSNSFSARVDFVTGTQPYSIEVGDIDGDGKPDLLVANYGDGTVSILRNTSVVGSLTTNSFAPKVDFVTGGGCGIVAVGDLDDDGKPDVVTANNLSNTVSLLRNISSPGILHLPPWRILPTPNYPLYVALVDLDGDGKLDLAVACYLSGTFSVFRNTSTVGSLTTNSLAPRIDYSLGNRDKTIAIGDLDGDGKPDLAMVEEINSVMSVFRNVATPGSFTNSSLSGPLNFATGSNPWGVAFGDLDGDGRPDIVFANNYGNTISIYQNQVPFGGPPLITIQPQSQTNSVGTTPTFTVTATGTVPLLYQWCFNGTNNPISGATNATLTLTNVQPGQAGSYSVLVSNIVGSTNAVATLTVNMPVSDPPPSGLVAWWQAEGNAYDSIGTNNGMGQNISYAAGEVGQSFVFNGTNSGIQVPASTSLNVGPQGGLTIETWINPANLNILNEWLAGWRVQNGGLGVDVKLSQAVGNGTQAGCIFVNLMDTSGNYHFLSTAPVLLSNVFQHVAVTYNKTNGIAAIYLNGAVVAQQNVGSFTPQTSYPFYLGTDDGDIDNGFDGQMDEVSVYSRALSSNEVVAIYNAGSVGKCFTPVAPVVTTQPTNLTLLAGGTAAFSVGAGGTQPLSYQWCFNGTNNPISGATNATLTLTNVQPGQAGSYSVLVSNIVGSTNSVATLTVVSPPVITTQPQSQTVLSYSSASFNVIATGTGSLTYQWQKNGTNLINGANVSGSTTTNLNLAVVSVADAGNYDVIVSNAYATTNSIVAVLTVPQTVMTLGSTNAMTGATVLVPVLMNALGVESAFQASVQYDPTKLALQYVQLGQVTDGSYLQEVDSQTNNGFVGFVVFLNNGTTVPAGTNEEVVDLVFQALAVTNSTPVNLAFGDNPTERQAADNNLDSLPVIYQNGLVTLVPAEYEADVYPRTNGNHQVNLFDWLEVGRMVSGLDVPANSDEFSRADCAPRNAPDGVLTVADWVQAGRYDLGLDPLTLVTLEPEPQDALVKGQVQNNGSGPVSFGLPSQGPTRLLQIGSVSSQRGQTVSVPVQLVCTTNENAVGITVGYDTNRLTFLNASLGYAITSGTLFANTNLTAGELGIALALSPSPAVALAAGTNQVAVLQFKTSPNASGTVPLTLDSSVVHLQVADNTAGVLPANYLNGAVLLPPQPTLATTMTSTNLQLSWALSSGSFQVQSADSPLGPWSILPLPLVTNGDNVTVMVQVTNQQEFFRLSGG